ncbi:T9SS type A sorting domain-containing protein [uncultured Winogradskyella sp.]|uniref:T9SS type A sorting domain-containing protein n=1 Tax=uncultured Winogradskyella sp. TaxID=395353 RepID=UPI00261425DB|nr:T9SS type A sorting domain-containing protein [uncultured Winogradskyella sp.]
MRRIYFLLLAFGLSFFGYAQLHYFQLVLENSNIGYEVFAGCQGCGFESNDEGLNAIFQTHNVIYYQNSPIYSTDFEDLYNATLLGACNGCDINLLTQDLNDYDSVIRIASSTNENDFLFNHGLSLNLVDNSIGIPNGVASGIVTTNDASLNQIFSDFNVSDYQLVNEGSSFERFDLFCDCDAVLLQQELDALSTTVSFTERLYMGVVLSTEEEQLTQVNIYPNPFTDKVIIKTNKTIQSVLLFDILGKQVYKSSSISDFEDFSSSLKAGVYLLEVSTSNGESVTKKLIKA